MASTDDPRGIELSAAALHVLEALEAECDKGYGPPRYAHTHDVARRAERSTSTVTRWMSMMSVDYGLIDATWRSGKPGGWKITIKGRGYLASLKEKT